MFVILPNQLFDKKYLDKKYQYVLYEHPHYFKKYKYNQKKLMLHRASMKYYHDYLSKDFDVVNYIEYDQPFSVKSYTLFDPVDKIKLSGKKTILDTPNFLLTRDHHKQYQAKTKTFFFHSFYMWSKQALNILPKAKSTDKQNRKRLPKSVSIPKISSNRGKTDQRYIAMGKELVDTKFSKNYGNTNGFMYPVTHSTARKWLRDFISKRIKNFGDFQDFIDTKNQTLFHSILSSSINIGLLNPREVIDAVLAVQSKIPMNSVEGFIRQLFWREYQRYCYRFYKFSGKNYFGNSKQLTKKWYTGTLGIPPVDDAIQSAFDTGYLHHIQRLMVVGNYMNLSGISPRQGFKWFMEFACDSYEWVMHQNVLDMVFFVSGGETMRKPYASSSNYILKMSNYKKDKWCDTWNTLYQNFKKKHKKKLWKYRYHFPGLTKL